MLSQSVQDLAVKKVVYLLNVDCFPCDMNQGDKVGSSAVREL